MYKYTYRNKKTGKNVYSHIELHDKDLELVFGVKTSVINPEQKVESEVKLKTKKSKEEDN